SAFAWAHALALSGDGRRVYAAGKSSQAVTNQDLWTDGLDAGQGRAGGWKDARKEHMHGPSPQGWGFEEELGAGIAAFGDTLLVPGRYADAIGGRQAWLGHVTVLRSDGSFVRRDLDIGEVASSTFSPPTRGLNAAASRAAIGAVSLALRYQLGEP